MKQPTRRQVEAVVTRLFENAQGERADRLVLTSADGRDLGGWCENAVVEQILEGFRRLAPPPRRRKP